MPDNDLQESQEIKENHQLTKDEQDAIIKKHDELATKINDFYLKRREPLNNDPVFELFDRLDKEKE